MALSAYSPRNAHSCAGSACARKVPSTSSAWITRRRAADPGGSHVVSVSRTPGPCPVTSICFGETLPIPRTSKTARASPGTSNVILSPTFRSLRRRNGPPCVVLCPEIVEFPGAPGITPDCHTPGPFANVSVSVPTRIILSRLMAGINKWPASSPFGGIVGATGCVVTGATAAGLSLPCGSESWTFCAFEATSEANSLLRSLCACAAVQAENLFSQSA
jgi:hypothetical protein